MVNRPWRVRQVAVKFDKPPSCLDSAYERKALMQGFSFKPVFPENQVAKTACKQQCKASDDRQGCVSCGRSMDEIIAAGLAARKGKK